MTRSILRRITGVCAVFFFVSCGSAQSLLNLRTSGLEDLAYEIDGRYASFLTPESGEGRDLNGDGDTQDLVPHLYDAASGVLRVLPFAAALSGSATRERGITDGHHAFAVSESGQGADLNGDGDQSDDVVHVYVARTATLLNLGLAGAELEALQVHGDLVSFLVQESAQGNADLNGDGDTDDSVVHVYHLATGAVVNTGLASGRLIPGDHLAFGVPEAGQGLTDLNGDGDMLDVVIHVYERGSGAAVNLGLAGDVGPSTGPRIGFEVWETSQGADLNGDGDLLDRVAHIYFVEGGATANFQVAVARVPRSRGGQVFLSVSEAGQQDTDLNGDGDALDLVPHVYGRFGAILQNLRVAEFAPPAFGDQGAVFTVSEAEQGGQDLNGDGDTDDAVVHSFHFSSGTLTNLGLAGSGFRVAPGGVISGNRFAFVVPEFHEGGTDLNFDGDTEDDVLYLAELFPGTVESTGFAVTGTVSVTETAALYAVSEAAQGGTDLNGDGDATDRVPHFRSFAPAGSTVNLRRGTSFTNALGPEIAIVPVLEAAEGRDLNGDLDAVDAVMHVVRMPSVESCGDGTVNLGAGPAADVLRINGAVREVTLPRSTALNLTLSAAPMGPLQPRYLLWAWRRGPEVASDVRSASGALLGCTINPTPAAGLASPQPFRCLGSTGLAAIGCQGITTPSGPDRGPLDLTHPGFARTILLTFQALLEDSGAANPQGFSVTNAVVVTVE